ncbi:hypothetical protein DOE78_15410 [Bacillus sp. Y1]|nr:anti-repressor SinI family protein [Bacillus sp. Y1]AYA76719.1 hypothetical protein DOE78_15410 [Bacillus sp. Y1]
MKYGVKDNRHSIITEEVKPRDNKKMEDLDGEWLELVSLAVNSNVTKDEFRNFLASNNSSEKMGINNESERT